MPHLLEAQSQGRRVETLESRPVLPASVAHVAAAARDLAADRTPAGFPFVAVCEWADRVGCDPFELADLLRAVSEPPDEGPASE